ncbi:MAG: nucleotidyltransferase family protein [Terriglobales bacterium]
MATQIARARLMGIVLAAGESSRMGRDKALLRWQGQTFLHHCVTKLAALCGTVRVVVGHHAATILAAESELKVDWRRNHDISRGRLSSLQVGLEETEWSEWEGAFVVPVDHPAFQAKTLRALLQRRAELPRVDVIKPRYQDHNGHPVFYSAAALAALAAAASRQKISDVAAKLATGLVEVDDPAVLTNVDTPDDLAALPQ